MMTEIEKNELVKKYEPLVNKLTKQYSSKVCMSFSDIKAMAYEGLAIAINTYDENRSSMSFQQFAGFAIRNNILTSLDNELRVVKLSAYAQKKAEDRGESLFNSVSLDTTFDGEFNNNGQDYVYKCCNNDLGTLELSIEGKFADGDVFETMYAKLEENFSIRDCEIFYRSFGLKDFDEEKGKDIAAYFGISRSLVSIRLNSILEFIRKDTELCEMLANLLNQ